MQVLKVDIQLISESPVRLARVGLADSRRILTPAITYMSRHTIEVDFKTRVLKHSKHHSNVSQSITLEALKFSFIFFYSNSYGNKLILEKRKLLRRCFTVI